MKPGSLIPFLGGEKRLEQVFLHIRAPPRCWAPYRASSSASAASACASSSRTSARICRSFSLRRSIAHRLVLAGTGLYFRAIQRHPPQLHRTRFQRDLQYLFEQASLRSPLVDRRRSPAVETLVEALMIVKSEVTFDTGSRFRHRPVVL